VLVICVLANTQSVPAAAPPSHPCSAPIHHVSATHSPRIGTDRHRGHPWRPVKVIRGSPIRHGTGELDKGGRPVGLPPSRFMGGAFDHAFRQVAILLKERQSDYATAGVASVLPATGSQTGAGSRSTGGGFSGTAGDYRRTGCRARSDESGAPAARAGPDLHRLMPLHGRPGPGGLAL